MYRLLTSRLHCRGDWALMEIVAHKQTNFTRVNLFLGRLKEIRLTQLPVGTGPQHEGQFLKILKIFIQKSLRHVARKWCTLVVQINNQLRGEGDTKSRKCSTTTHLLRLGQHPAAVDIETTSAAPISFWRCTTSQRKKLKETDKTSSLHHKVQSRRSHVCAQTHTMAFTVSGRVAERRNTNADDWRVLAAAAAVQAQPELSSNDEDEDVET